MQINPIVRDAIEAALRDLQQYAHIEQTIATRRLLREALEKGFLCGTV